MAKHYCCREDCQKETSEEEGGRAIGAAYWEEEAGWLCHTHRKEVANSGKSYCALGPCYDDRVDGSDYCQRHTQQIAQRRAAGLMCHWNDCIEAVAEECPEGLWCGRHRSEPNSTECRICSEERIEGTPFCQEHRPEPYPEPKKDQPQEEEDEDMSEERIEGEAVSREAQRSKGHSRDASAPDIQNAISVLSGMFGGAETERLQAEIDALNGRLNSIVTFEKMNEGTLEPCLELAHYKLPLIAHILAQGLHVFLVGPAGSGKTTMATQIADMLKVRFAYTSKVDQKYELIGFVNAQGDYVRTAFRDAVEQGGLFLWDEIDASSPAALTAFNAALDNGRADFPDGVIDVHEDFVCVAAGNTWGLGADRQYVGRNQLDAATLDRYVQVELPYDETLEAALCGVEAQTDLSFPDWRSARAPSGQQLAAYVHDVQRWRKKAMEENIRVVISPRASIKGCQLLRAQVKRSVVEEICVWRGMAPDVKRRIKAPPKREDA